jgi:hypothetical protein
MEACGRPLRSIEACGWPGRPGFFRAGLSGPPGGATCRAGGLARQTATDPAGPDPACWQDGRIRLGRTGSRWRSGLGGREGRDSTVQLDWSLLEGD